MNSMTPSDLLDLLAAMTSEMQSPAPPSHALPFLVDRLDREIMAADADTILEFRRKMDALITLACYSKVASLDRLLSLYTPPEEALVLVSACEAPDEMIEYLVSKGLDPNGMNESGNTAISHAISCGNYALVVRLLELGFDVSRPIYKDRFGQETTIGDWCDGKYGSFDYNPLAEGDDRRLKIKRAALSSTLSAVKDTCEPRRAM